MRKPSCFPTGRLPASAAILTTTTCSGAQQLGRADYLITGDDDLLAVRQFRDVAIVDARAFLAVLSAEHE